MTQAMEDRDEGAGPWARGLKVGAVFTRKADATSWTVRLVEEGLVVLSNPRFAGAERIQSGEEFRNKFSAGRA